MQCIIQRIHANDPGMHVAGWVGKQKLAHFAVSATGVA